MFKLLIFASLTLFFTPIQPNFASETIKGAKKDLDAFKQEMSVELAAIEKNLKVMTEKAEKKSDVAYKDAVTDLTEKRDSLRSDLYDLDADTKGEWKKAKSSLSSSLNSLNERIQKALKD